MDLTTMGTGLIAPSPSSPEIPADTNWIARALARVAGSVEYSQTSSGTVLRVGGIVVRRDSSGQIQVYNETGVEGSVSRTAAAVNTAAATLNPSKWPLIIAGGIIAWLLWG